MSGTIELDRDGKTLLIGFPYREDLVAEVRNMPGRRWDRGSKQWRVPVAHAELVVSTFMRHGFEVSGGVSGLLAGTGGALELELELAEIEDEPREEPPGITVGQLNERARSALRTAFTRTVRVVGEVMDFEKTRGRKHLFFNLVEKDATGTQVAASVSAALFERTAQRVLARLEGAGLELADGVEILVEARVDLYPATGRFQLIVEEVHPEFTLGKLALSREQILAELRTAGVDRRNAGLPWPVPALRIGVLTSPTSDGWNDFRRELEASGIGFDVALHPVHVQGALLERTVLAGLAWFAEHAEDFDVLCILRGGGSRTDLAWFDNRDVAFAVARHPLKVLCGIGHERDRSILDEIAASQKTPTAAGAFVVAQFRATRDALIAESRRLRECARDALVRERQRLASRAHSVRRVVHGRIVRESGALDAAAARLGAGTRARVRSERTLLARESVRLVRASRQRIERERARVDGWTTRQRLLDPARVLERGFAIVRGPDGKAIDRVAALRAGDAIEIALRDGRARAHVDATEPDPGI